jgi:hypothetical protein
MEESNNSVFNTELTEEQNEKFHELFHELKDMLPFGVGLSPRDKQKLATVGATRYALIDKADIMIDLMPEVLPPTFDKDKYKMNLTLMKQFRSYISECKMVLEILSDTYAVLSDEVFKKSVQFKSCVEVAANLDLPYDEMLKELDYMPRYKKRKIIDGDL